MTLDIKEIKSEGEIIRVSDIDPSEIQKHEPKRVQILEWADALEIKGDEQNAEAVAFLASIKKLGKEVKEHRLSITRPMDEAKKKVMNLFAPFLDAIEKAEKTAKKKMVDYRREVEAERRRIEEENAKKLKETESHGMEAFPELEKPVEQPKTKGQSFRVVRKWEVGNMGKIPSDYFVLDEKKINAAVKAGISIPGIRTWEDKEVTIRA